MRTHRICGFLSAIAGLVSLARTNSANAEYGSSYLLMAILVAVLGGISVNGGHGRLAGVVLALVSLQMLSTGFNMLLSRYSGSNFFRDFAWGFLLLFVMVFARIKIDPPAGGPVFLAKESDTMSWMNGLFGVNKPIIVARDVLAVRGP